MISVIEALYKNKDKIDFGWKPEPGAVSYNVYVGLAPGVMVSLATGIPSIPSDMARFLGKIPYSAQIADVRTALSLAATVDFSTRVFYFAIVYTNALSVTSTLADSTIVEVPPPGIVSKAMKDDPSINRHIYFFSPEDQNWVKAVGSSSGALVVETADFFKSNITTVYTYDGTNLSTIKSYPSDATVTGYPAKLTTYTYNVGGLVSKIQITDSTI